MKWIFIGILAILSLLWATETYILMPLYRAKAGKHGQWVDVGEGRRIFSYSKGTGPVTFLVETGIGSFSGEAKNLVDQLATLGRVISLDRWGYGLSDAEFSTISLEQAHQDVLKVLEAHEATHVIYVGHSMGALYARSFQQHFPSKVRGLVLLDPVVPDPHHMFFSPRQIRKNRGDRLRELGQLISATLGISRLWLYMSQAVDFHEGRRMWEATKSAHHLKTWQQEKDAIYHLSQGINWDEGLENIPIMIITGTKNPHLARPRIARHRLLTSQSSNGIHHVRPDFSHRDFLGQEQASILTRLIKNGML